MGQAEVCRQRKTMHRMCLSERVLNSGRRALRQTRTTNPEMMTRDGGNGHRCTPER